MRQCGNCRFWSEMCARSIGCGEMEAACLAPDGPKHGKFTRESFVCEAWKEGYLGAIDQPGLVDWLHVYEIEDEEPAF